MQKQEYNNIFKNEDTHFYYVGYHNIIISQLKKYLSAKSTKLKILDAGCGTGGLTKKLSTFGETIGIDISEKAIKLAKKRGLKVQKGSINKINFPNKNFDVVVSVDVLYHQWVEDDKAAIKELLRVLKPGGILLLKLPAYEFLRSSHDLVVYTKKRYTKKDLLKLFKGTQATIIKASFLGSFLLPIIIFKIFTTRIAGRIKPYSSVGKLWNPINNLLILCFNIENILMKYTNIPFGISILAIAKKK